MITTTIIEASLNFNEKTLEITMDDYGRYTFTRYSDDVTVDEMIDDMPLELKFVKSDEYDKVAITIDENTSDLDIKKAAVVTPIEIGGGKETTK